MAKYMYYVYYVYYVYYMYMYIHLIEKPKNWSYHLLMYGQMTLATTFTFEYFCSKNYFI